MNQPISEHRSGIKRGLAIAGCLWMCAVIWNPLARSRRAAERTSRTDDTGAIREFASLVQVFESPRCANCHISGDSPLQGDDGHPHTMNVKRGPDGRGTPAMRCTNCHQDQSSRLANAPPGGPDWHLPPPDRPMAWRGLSAGALCRLLKDPNRNGHRDLAALVEHIRSDKLVNSCWNPGPTRNPPPIPHDEFVQRFVEWVRDGAACPE